MDGEKSGILEKNPPYLLTITDNKGKCGILEEMIPESTPKHGRFMLGVDLTHE